MKLDDIHTRKGLLSGTQIAEIFDIKPGKILKDLIDELTNFQILFPEATPEDAKVYMEGKKEEFL